MPTYDYFCNKCHKEVEIAHSINAPAPAKCPKCGAKNSLKKMVSAARGIVFKGSGFYETDYKRSSAKPDASDSKAPASTQTVSPKKKCNPGCGCH